MLKFRTDGIALVLLLGIAGLFVLPDIPIDADVLKTALCALVALPVACLVLARQSGSAAMAWLTSTGGRLFVASVLLAGLGSSLAGRFSDGLSSSVIDRLLQVLLALVAGALGADAARRTPRLLASTLLVLGSVVAVVCLAQAAGLENSLSPPAATTAGFKEVVGTLGNSNRAGAVLALCLAAALAALLGPGHRGRGQPDSAGGNPCLPGKPHEPPTPAAPTVSKTGRVSPLLLVLLGLLTAALLLTRSRGGRLAALAAGLVLLWAWRSAWQQTRLALMPMLGGLVLALLVGGLDVLWAHKLPDNAAVLAGTDVTMDVRLSLWSATTDMVSQGPILGWGLGEYRQAFPAFREAAEAGLPGLQGAATSAWHPHNEFLLAAAEGGGLAGLALGLFALLTLRRALSVLRRDRDEDDLTALGVLVAGSVLAMTQDAWVSPGSGLIYFAAAGSVWGAGAVHTHIHPDAPVRRWPVWVAALLIALVAVGLAWPRWAGHIGAWRFQRAAQERAAEGRGIDIGQFELLASAAAVAPADPDLQHMLTFIGRQLLPGAPADSRPSISAALAEAALRLEALDATRPSSPR